MSQEIDEYIQELKDNDPLWDIRVELGRLLLILIHLLTESQKKRFKELEKLIEEHDARTRCS